MKVEFEYNDILTKLYDAGYNTSRIRKEKLIAEKTLQSIRENRDVKLSTIIKISVLTNTPIDNLVKIKKED